jgi:hypothetical protein
MADEPGDDVPSEAPDPFADAYREYLKAVKAAWERLDVDAVVSGASPGSDVPVLGHTIVFFRPPAGQCVGHFVETPLHTAVHPPHCVASISTSSTLAGHTVIGPVHTAGMGMLGSPHC